MVRLLIPLTFLISWVLIFTGWENFLNSKNEIEVTKEMNEVISEYIVDLHEDSFHPTDKQFQVHKVYGASEEDGIINVYIYSQYQGFNLKTGKEVQSEQSLPAVVELNMDGLTYTVTAYKEVKDGSEYLTSIEEMFPRGYVRRVIKDSSGSKLSLEKEMEDQLVQWLQTAKK